MYKRVLIPLDGSKDSEGVFRMIRDEIAPGGEVILMQVPPMETKNIDGKRVSGATQEDEAGVEAMRYPGTIADRIRSDIPNVRYDTMMSHPIVEGIVDFARKEQVDLIAMYTHDRKGIAKFVQRSVAKEVSKQTRRDMKIFKPQEILSNFEAG
jgi:nucleotide-binding universal stress UspA family protein